MPDSQVEEIKNKIDIVSVIGEHVKLTKSGSNFRGLCPFHSEKSPSFMVSEELQIYKCFGCGEGGDVFTFLEKYEGMEFPEALRFLAEKSGVVLKRSGSFEVSDKDVLYELNNLAAKFYNFLLTSHKVGKVALNYLKEERKIGDAEIKSFNIGYAPSKSNVLSNFLIKKKKYKVKDIERAGLIFVSKSGSIYDRFEGRIIFPISDHRGNVIALAGRQLPPGNPKMGKYINSPETEIYHKSSSLFGLNITKDFIKKENFAVVAEGELDLISSYRVGIKNIVAIKGSAFTVDQAKLLGRYTKEVVLALDTDFAGIAAAIRGIKILEDEGFDIKVALLGMYKDPDEAAIANPDFYKEKIKEAVGVWDFVIDSIIAKYDKDTASGKRKISKELTPILASIGNKIIQEHYVNKLAKLLEVSEEAVISEVEKVNIPGEKKEEKKIYTTDDEKSISEVRQEKFVSLILKIKPSLLKDKKVQALITVPILKRLAEEFKVEDFGKSLPKELFEKFGDLVLGVEEGEDKEIKGEINELYKILSHSFLKQELLNSKESHESGSLQNKLKDLESGKFERIIE
jgi:DNA primase